MWDLLYRIMNGKASCITWSELCYLDAY